MKVVLVMYKDEERRDFPVAKGVTVVGRARECDLRIPTRDTSRRHCEITVSDKGVAVRDLNSSNGVFVNGRRVEESRLNAGDKLTIGPVRFIVQIDGKPATIKPSDTALALEDADASAVTAVKMDKETTEIDDILEIDEIDLDLDDVILDDEDEEKDEMK